MGSRQQPEVCIIGAGSSGITAAQTLHARGVDFDCFEAGSTIGGNWRYLNDNGMSSAYRSLHINTSRQAMEYRAFPMSEDLPDYPSHWQIAQYFDDFVDHFGFRDKITFRTEVVKVEPHTGGRPPVGPPTGEEVAALPASSVPSNQARSARGSTGYDVTLRGRDEQGDPAEPEVRRYRHVIVANGHHWDPRWPEPSYPGAETFPGVQLHAHYYKAPDLLVDKSVLVLGIGNSATDIAVESSRTAAKTYLAMRRGAHIVPKYVFGVPTDHLTDSPLARGPLVLQQLAMTAMLRLTQGRITDYGLPKPDHAVLHAHPTVSDDLLTRLGHGDIAVLPNIDRFEGSKVFFTDGSAHEVDVVIYCTGHQVTFPFLDDRVVRARDNHIDLYRRVVDPEHPGLFFIGLVQPIGAIMPLAEIQSAWVADLVTGRGALPSYDEMRVQIRRYDEALRRRYVASKRHTIQVDFHKYYAEIEREREAARARVSGNPVRRGLRRGRRS